MHELPSIPICPLDHAFHRMGGKHKGRIVWRLGQGMCRYGEIRRSISGITTKMLTQTLHDLVEDGLVERVSYPESPPRVEYFLTDAGRELLPVIEMLKAWGERQLKRSKKQTVNTPTLQLS